jgi:hypothetical protein
VQQVGFMEVWSTPENIVIFVALLLMGAGLTFLFYAKKMNIHHLMSRSSLLRERKLLEDLYCLLLLFVLPPLFFSQNSKEALNKYLQSQIF